MSFAAAPEDIKQLIWKSFFRHHVLLEFTDVHNGIDFDNWWKIRQESDESARDDPMIGGELGNLANLFRKELFI